MTFGAYFQNKNAEYLFKNLMYIPMIVQKYVPGNRVDWSSRILIQKKNFMTKQDRGF